MKRLTMEYIIENQQEQIKKLKEDLKTERIIKDELAKQLAQTHRPLNTGVNKVFDGTIGCFFGGCING